MRKINLAIVGATGAVGEVALTILAQRQFPIDKLYLVASKNSAGRTISFQGETLPVVNLEDFDFSVETKRFLKNDFSLNKFLNKFIHLVNLKS